MNDDTIYLGDFSREQILEQMIQVRLVNPTDGFLIIKETLTRCGIANIEQKRLYQSCHIFHKKGKFYIVHFKEMLAMDGFNVSYSTEDRARRNTVVNQLADWNLVELIVPGKSESPVLEHDAQLYILPHNQKKNWKLFSKYSMGKVITKHTHDD